MSKRGLLAGISIATNTPTPPMKKCCRLVVANLLLVSVQPSPSSAQSDSATKPQPRLCWRGKPAPECTAFWITEFGYDAMQSWTQHTIVYDYGSGYSTTETRRDFGSRAVWTIGPMFNTRPLGAVGGTLSLSFVPGGYRTAVEARRRWWGPLGNSFDLSAGLLQMNVRTVAVLLRPSSDSPPARTRSVETSSTSTAAPICSSPVDASASGRASASASARTPRPGAWSRSELCSGSSSRPTTIEVVEQTLNDR